MAPEPRSKSPNHNGVTSAATTNTTSVRGKNGVLTSTSPTQDKDQQQQQQQQQPSTDVQRRPSDADSVASDESYENYIPTPPDGGWGWVIVVASLVCNAIVDGIGYSFGVFLLEFTTYFNESKSKVSLVGSLLCGVYLFAGPVVSALTNKFGCRAVAVTGSAIAGASFLLSIMAPSIDVLIITYGVMGGFGLGMVYLPSIVSVGYYFEKKRALATGIAVCGSGIGTFIFAPLSEFLLHELDWKNALLIISGITLNGAVFGMLMRPLEPTKKGKRPRAKNLLDRIKEKGNRGRTVSEMSSCAYSVRDTNAVLERVMEAKLQRERRLQEDDSELGSLPSIFVRQQSRKDSASGMPRAHKLSISEKGELSSPVGSVPKIVLQDSDPHLPPHSSCPLTTTAELTEAESSSSADEEGRVSRKKNPEVTKEECRMTKEDSKLTKEDSDLTCVTAEDGEVPAAAAAGKDQKQDSAAGGRGVAVSRTVSSLQRAHEDVLSEDSFNDAESGTIGEGTNTERSDYFTPPSSPPEASSPTTPEKEGVATEEEVATRERQRNQNGYIQRKSDPEVSRLLIQREKGNRNGSVPSNIHHHIHEVTPLLEVPISHSKRTLVTLGCSDRNIWRLKAATNAPVGSLHSLSVSKKDLARPMYRKDIFYSGSVLNIPQFRSQPDMKSYITSITTIPGEMALVSGGESKVWSYLCFPQSVKDTLQEMMDFSLVKDLGFMLICFGNILAFLGFYVPFVFSIDMAVSYGIDKTKAAFLISIIGITNTVGRVVTGWLADLRKIDSLVITYVSIFVCGLSTAAFPFCKSFALLCVAASVFGLSVAAFISLSSILICDLLGLEKLTNGFGLMTMFRGVAAMAGPPLAGFIYDQTKSYDASFYTGGGLLILGALSHLALRLPFVKVGAPELQAETIIVEDISANHSGSGVKPELITMDEVMTNV